MTFLKRELDEGLVDEGEDFDDFDDFDEVDVSEGRRPFVWKCIVDVILYDQTCTGIQQDGTYSLCTYKLMIMMMGS